MGTDAAAVRTAVRGAFGLDLGPLVPVGGGADAAAEVWRGTSDDGRGWAVKWSGGGSPAGLLVPALLAARGVPGVPAPLAARDGRPWADVGGRRLSVAPWVDAPPALGSRTTPAHWTAVGALLAAVHATAVPPDLAAVLPRAGDRTAAARSARLRGLAGPAPDPWTADVLALTDELLAAARRLGARLSGTPVLCHGDPHLGNLLAGPDGRVWLLDWDDAVLGPREVDLLHVLGGVFADDPVGPERQAAVAAGYGPLAPDPVALAWARCLRAVEDVCDLAADAIDPALPPAARERGRALVEGSRPGIVAQARASLRELY